VADTLEIHIISDSTGGTAARVARAAQSQFGDSEIELHRHARVKSREQLARALEAATGRRAAVFYTLVDPGLREAVVEISRQHRLVALDVLGPALNAITTASGMQAMQVPGRQAPLDAQYFRRIAAIEFAVKHDDGRGADDLQQADVVLVGVSRTSKTPTSIYLANRGVRTANVPLVPGAALPPALETLRAPLVVGLFASPERIVQIRQNRLLGLNVQRDDDQYIDRQAVAEEVAFSRRLCTRNNWPLIDVTRRSIEETAAAVMALLADRRRAPAT
jgi:regulator of PEP synthase PpsR (kinase-PPPase family)